MQACGCRHGLLKQSKGVLLIASSSKSGRVRPARMCDVQLAPFSGRKRVAGPHSMWFLAASNPMWTTMELIMSTTFYTPATIRVRSRGSELIATVKK
jgi:hypothetical protein